MKHLEQISIVCAILLLTGATVHGLFNLVMATDHVDRVGLKVGDVFPTNPPPDSVRLLMQDAFNTGIKFGWSIHRDGGTKETIEMFESAFASNDITIIDGWFYTNKPPTK